jgi:TolB-like protein/DNA-binding winged helix-turn-helix (wHTH) protein/Tfp pilus assembly protein PilF
MQVSTQTRRVHFGAFEADLHTCELRKHGLRVKLQDQPFQVLALLLQKPGEMVSREELRQNLWPEDTFVDFDVGLNNAIKRLRGALNDSADEPRYIETLPRHGYRFIAPIENGVTPGEAGPPIASAAADVEPPSAPVLKPATEVVVPSAVRPVARRLWITTLSVAVLLSVVIGVNPRGWRDRFLGRSPAVHIQSIAVLPLQNLTGDPTQEYFADGMTEALITDLAQINTLTVISQTSVMRYKGSSKSLPQIAKELNVEGVVEGAVVRSGNRVRIDAQLIYAPTDRHFWAKSYERGMSDVLSLQREVAQAIANEIRAKLTPSEQAHLASARPVNPEAYEAYLKGRYYFEKRSGPALNTAIEYYEQAIKIDPNFALAYAGLADAYNIAGFGLALSMPQGEAGAKSRAAAVKAVELDGSLAEAHTALAHSLQDADRDWAASETEYRRAIELNPGYANAYLWYSQLLRERSGRRAEDLAMTRRALQLDPMSPIMLRNMGSALWWWGDIDQAIEQYRKALAIDPNRFNVLLVMGGALTEKGMYAEATADLQKALTLSPGNIRAQGILGYIYAITGRRAEARKILNQLKRLPNKPLAPQEIALIYAALGRNEEALRWLQKTAETPNTVNPHYPLFVDPRFRELRNDPRFQESMRPYAEYWKRNQ